MMKWSWAGIVMVAVFAASAEAQVAQPQVANPLVMTVHNVTAASQARAGTPRSHEHAVEGDTLHYRLTFSNTQASPLRNVQFDNPIPTGLGYVDVSAKASTQARIEFSIDGGESYSLQPMVEVEENGIRRRVPADPSQYTHVRWKSTGAVAPGATVVAEFRAVLTGVPAPPKATAGSGSRQP
jgi:uncharacterized repeat protein (TIGR01451 family)